MEFENRLLNFLLEYVSDERRARFLQLVANRTQHITIVLENIFQPHNASAVLRSCDCFGIQDVHIIENYNTYRVNPNIALGASKWLTMYRYNETENNTVSCLKSLKEKGYTLVATSPHHCDFPLSALPLEQKVAVMLGTELQGLSEEAFAMADCTLGIPMFGFTESFNISVSAALIMYELTKRLHASSYPWRLGEKEREEVLLAWVRASIKKPEMLEKAFYERVKEE
ncbi:MAG: rRNA methyltransferase [Bacteroidetes bacterium]|nr:MAG: rRNA methyltransferase [Bacteroidota bacterium]